MKLWVDDVRQPPDKTYIWSRSVDAAKASIEYSEYLAREFDLAIYEVHLIDIDHDAGIYASEGGDYVKLLDWLEETGRNYPIRIHSMNPVGVENMRRIIKRNGWREVQNEQGIY